MTTLPLITALTAACIVVLQLTLMMMVGFKRLEYSQGLGDGGRADLLAAIRRHGNLAENSGLFLISLALVEILGGSLIAVGILGGGFVVIRVSHAVGLSLEDGSNAARALGAVGTVVSMGATALYLAYLVISQSL